MDIESVDNHNLWEQYWLDCENGVDSLPPDWNQDNEYSRMDQAAIDSACGEYNEYKTK